MAENLRDSAEAPIEYPNDSLHDPTHADAAPIVTGRLCGGKGYAIWRTRGTGDYLLMLTLSGGGRVNGLSVGAGDIVVLRPGVRHDYGTAPGADTWEILWAHFLPRPHWLAWLAAWPEATGSRSAGVLRLALVGERYRAVEAALQEMHARAVSGLPRRDDFARASLEEALLWCAAARPGDCRFDPRVERALAFVQESVARPVTLHEIAAAAGLSTSRLSHLFKAQVGLTPPQFLERERIARACQLLTLTARPIGEIAADVGFESAIHFSARFRKAVGVSPRSYRQSRT
jgi:AraC family transcriptional regulator of arabinose operon